MNSVKAVRQPRREPSPDLESLPDIQDLLLGTVSALIKIPEERVPVQVPQGQVEALTALDGPLTALVGLTAPETLPVAGTEDNWSREDRLRPKSSLRATARLRERSRRRGDARRSRSRGVASKRT